MLAKNHTKSGDKAAEVDMNLGCFGGLLKKTPFSSKKGSFNVFYLSTRAIKTMG